MTFSTDPSAASLPDTGNSTEGPCRPGVTSEADDATSVLPLSALHHRTASCAVDVSARGAALFGVTRATFENWRWQMKHQISTADELSRVLRLSDNESQAFGALEHIFHSGISPYMAALLASVEDPSRLALQLVPRLEELSDALGVADPLQEVSNSPVKEMVHVYKDRVAWCVAQLCPVYCRYCFRKRRDDEAGLHFNPALLEKGLRYLEEHTEIRDVLLTGGDPLISHDGSLRALLTRLRAIPHIQIIRIGTRVPVALPYRITEALADLLAEFHPLWINTHFNCPQELTPQAAAGIDRLLSRGIPVGNQSVLLKGVNDDADVMRDLLEGLVRMRVRPYYLYQAQIVQGTEHLRVPIEKGLALMRSLRGSTTGFAIPQYVLDTPTGKIPLSPNHFKRREGDSVVLENLRGEEWSEPNPP